MSAKDAHRATAQHAMKAASQRDALLVEVLRFEKQLTDENLLALRSDLENGLGWWADWFYDGEVAEEKDKPLVATLFEHIDTLRRIAHDITSGGVATNDALPQDEP